MMAVVSSPKCVRSLLKELFYIKSQSQMPVKVCLSQALCTYSCLLDSSSSRKQFNSLISEEGFALKSTSLVSNSRLLQPHYRYFNSKVANRRYSNVVSSDVNLPVVAETDLEWEHGNAKIQLTLPSFDRPCWFFLNPVLGTVQSFCAEVIHAGEGGVKFAHIYDKDGIQISAKTPISLVLLKDFQVRINDRFHNVKVAPLPVPDQEIEAIRNVVSRLYSTMQIDDFFQAKQEALLNKIGILQQELEPLEKEKLMIDNLTENRTGRVLWTGLALMGLQLGFFARLTWWEYSWDIMEPVTYFATFTTAMGCYAYYLVTRDSYEYPQAKDRLFLRFFHRDAKKRKFDVVRYNELKQRLNITEAELRQLRHPLLLEDRGAMKYPKGFDESST